ncbi:DNA adenine methylase [Pantoea rwandensis]|uniref:Site-specific DNA-methyltransferase (adenine-specific) n=1 Tax=Pantoea rwandensis TaxID=1076550 RepID=A0ABM5RFZ1_9GAMM|nr:DNA adenine methylase [Pantoea rwandensis]AIR84873.1 DNA adenine methylase [Pantoea rwandensis]
MSTILKWAGSKAGIMPALSVHLPQGKRLVEPFAGSCAVMMNTDYPQYLIADINPDLINLYRQVKEHTRPFIVMAAQMFNQNANFEDYYRIRGEFNLCLSLTLLQRAVYFLYLNRHGYRGLCRYNQKGGFNTPFAKNDTAYFPLAEIEAFAEKAQRATFICADFKETLQMVEGGDVVYCDPPYDGTFSQYFGDGFGKEQHSQLASMLAGIADTNAVVCSNSDNEFTRQLYSRFNTSSVTAPRSIGSKAGDAKRGAEIIAVLKPQNEFAVIGWDMASGPDISVEAGVPQ